MGGQTLGLLVDAELGEEARAEGIGVVPSLLVIFAAPEVVALEALDEPQATSRSTGRTRTARRAVERLAGLCIPNSLYI